MSVTLPLWRGGKLSAILRVLADSGPRELVRRVRQYAVYHLKDKWEFIYLEFPLHAPLAAFPVNESVQVRIAVPSDVDRLETCLFARMTGPDIGDRRYLPLIGRDDVRCFLAERDGAPVHYSWVFLDARTSPLRDVPFGGRIDDEDVYIGPVYTDPSARGFIYPHVLTAIIRHLREGGRVGRVLVLVAGNNRAAVSFYRKMGFREIPPAARRRFWRAVRGRRAA